MSDHDPQPDQRTAAEAGAREGKALPKFTPGPWRPWFLQGVNLLIQPKDWTQPDICEIHQPGRGCSEIEANARLIAASPDLYAACHRAHAALDAALSALAGLDPPAGSRLDELCGELQAARDGCEGALGRAEGGEA